MCMNPDYILLLVFASACLAYSLCKLYPHLTCSSFPTAVECWDAVCCKIFIELFLLFVGFMSLDIVACSFPLLFVTSVWNGMFQRDSVRLKHNPVLVLFQWMKDMWRSDPCYASYGVDGSTCSFFIYLSEVSNLYLHKGNIIVPH